MAAPPPGSPLREMLDRRLAELLREVESCFEAQAAARIAEACRRARRETAEQLNQAVRLLQRARGAEELGAALVDAAGRHAAGAALLFIEGADARGARISGVSEEEASVFSGLSIPLASAAAMANAAESLEPVVSETTAAQVSAEIAGLLENDPEGRVSIFPVVVSGHAVALLCAWGGLESALVELLAQAAAAFWPPAEAPHAGLVTIQSAQTAQAAESAAAWDRLSPEDRRMHLRAQRFARVQTAEIRLRQGPAVHAGRAQRDIYESLRTPIDAARAAFREKFFTACPSMVDYLHLELVRTLANDDSELLGKNYPGPLA